MDNRVGVLIKGYMKHYEVAREEAINIMVEELHGALVNPKGYRLRPDPHTYDAQMRPQGAPTSRA
jgi:hypothetical protein